MSEHFTHVAEEAVNKPGSSQSETSTTVPAESNHPPLTALDLAHLAARLDPDLCKSNPDAALLNAFALYQWAALFLEGVANRSLNQLYIDLEREELQATPLVEMLVKQKTFAIWGKANKERTEREKLRFYPKKTSDEVRSLLKVTTERGVKNQLQRWFVARAGKQGRSAREGRRDFTEFWAKARRKEEGKRCYAIDVIFSTL